MERSTTLMTAQIHFIDDLVSLINIPLAQYTHYVQPLLQLLYPVEEQKVGADGQPIQNVESTVPWSNQHPFLNISITPIECSVVCSRSLARKYFEPVVSHMSHLKMQDRVQASISKEDFVVVSVEGEGLEASQRVLELTTPLAMAGISIFFITTYFSDYILVPSKSRDQVIRALEDRGFAFVKSAEAYVNAGARHHQRHPSSSSSFEYAPPPSTPPPTTISELQARTFSLLNRRNIVPEVQRNIRLIQCAGRRDSLNSPSSAKHLELQIGLMKCLLHPPQFLSLTLVESEDASVLLEKDALHVFGSDDVLLGSKENYLVPIILDLEPLPFEATGIVCGVAGKLVGPGGGGGGGTGLHHSFNDAVEMNYLSTAKSGAIIVDENDLERAVEALRQGEFGLDVL
ncbi:hypothetical protein MMC09_001186 [Bachmanniomyces sp. S44760]|nr:hypothetical protein [Bachmanniomyces sp. S44760]